MKGYTLISCVGMGVYDQTEYEFPLVNKKYKTSLFLEAILQTQYRAVKKVILVGTRTSNWSILIPYSDQNEENKILSAKISEECKNRETGISEESITELKSKLFGWYNNIPFEIIAHTSDFSKENVKDIFSAYETIPDLLEPDTNILFDISHGFRSMPLLVYQSLQVSSIAIAGRKVELIYGEKKQGVEISYVRDLSEYWDYYEISTAIKLFDQKLDGRLLAKKIKPFWERGADFLIRLSDIVEYDFSLQIPDAFDGLEDAIIEFERSPIEKPEWVIDVRKKVEEIYSSLYKKNETYPYAKTVYEFTKLLRKKKLITQTVIALQVVVETAMAEKYAPGDLSKIGNYDWYQETGRKKMKSLRKKDNLIVKLDILEGIRNQIAHGGGRDYKGDYPNTAKINAMLKNINHIIGQFFDLLDKEP